MSFSFIIRAATMAAACAAAAREMDKVVQGQAVHAHDRAAVLNAVKAQTELVNAPMAGKHAVLTVSGSLGWQGVAPGTANPPSDDFAYTSANVNVGLSLTAADAKWPEIPVATEEA